MGPIVVDAAIVLAWLLQEHDATTALDLLDKVYIHGALAPPIWRLEVLNGLLAAVRQKRLAHNKIDRVLADAAQIPMEVDQLGSHYTWTRVSRMAQSHDLTAYDATYLELATRRGCILATFDRKLAAAANKEGVLVLPA